MRSTDKSAPPTRILTVEYDHASDEPISAQVVRSVAVAADREATDLEPLGSTIDVDALEQLVHSRSFTDQETMIEVLFSYEGYLVEIEANGTVNIYNG